MLYKSQNSKHASHPSKKFSRASIRLLEELAEILGSAELTFLTQDDKAKVPYWAEHPKQASTHAYAHGMSDHLA